MSPLTQEQQQALDILANGVQEGREELSLSGHAGTGKTTIIPYLQELLSINSVPSVVVTPTNKAAAVLKSKGVDAATLYAVFFRLVENHRRRLTFEPNYKANSLPPEKLRFIETIIVDEASMLSSWALGHLRQMCDTLILVGDANQLPPVGDRDCPRGHFCTRKHDATLTQVLRNEGDILRLATEVRTSSRPKAIDLDRFYPPASLPFATMVNVERPQFVCWRNVVRKKVNARVRQALDFTDPLPVPGDIVVCRNNYSDWLLNGTQATVVSFNWVKGTRFAKAELEVAGRDVLADVDMVRFVADQLPSTVREQADSLRGVFVPPDDEDAGAALTFGYAITAHTAQGGEWPCVAVVDERAAVWGVANKEHQADKATLPPDDACRRWAYTAITRAQSQLYVVDDSWLMGRV
jgi:exodeoxyribonuclease-5